MNPFLDNGDGSNIPPMPTRSEPKVEIVLNARQDKSWFWTVKVYSSTFKLLGEKWCPQISKRDVDGRCQDVLREISVTAGAIAEHQQMMQGSTFDPSEVAALAVEVYREFCADLEKKHGNSVPKRGLRSDGGT